MHKGARVHTRTGVEAMVGKQATETTDSKKASRTCERLVGPVAHIGRGLIDWMGTLTLSGGDLDGEPFTVWPWERSLYPGNLSPAGRRRIVNRAGQRQERARGGAGGGGCVSRRAAPRDAA